MFDVRCPILSFGRWALAALLVTAVILPICLLADTPEPDPRRDATVVAVEEAMPSVVNIRTTKVIRNEFLPIDDPFNRGRQGLYYSLGSGVVIDETGYLLTNDHVVRGVDQIFVKFSTGTNVYEATVIATDPSIDVALLKLKVAPGERFKAIRMAREDDLLLGETVLAMGNPFGLGGTVTRGILSSKSRQEAREGQPLDANNLLQTDAAINPGNSGGPLINMRGELIGINVGEWSQVRGQLAQGIGFAIPVRQVLQALSNILPAEFVRGRWFGARVRVGAIPMVVTTVQPDSPAGKAGIQPGDAILRVNGATPKSFIDFADLLAAGAANDVTLDLRRGAEEKTVTVQLVPEKSVFNADLVRRKLGIDLDKLPPDAGQGYLITAVQDGSPAAIAGLKRGMLLTGVDGELPSDVTALAKHLYAKKSGEPVHMDLTLRTQAGPFSMAQPASVDLTPR